MALKKGTLCGSGSRRWKKMTEYFQEIIYDMKTVRHLAEQGIIFTDESLREAGRKGTIAGKELRKRLIL